MKTHPPEHRRTFAEYPGLTTLLLSAARSSHLTWKNLVPATVRNGVMDLTGRESGLQRKLLVRPGCKMKVPCSETATDEQGAQW